MILSSELLTALLFDSIWSELALVDDELNEPDDNDEGDKFDEIEPKDLLAFDFFELKKQLYCELFKLPLGHPII